MWGECGVKPYLGFHPCVLEVSVLGNWWELERAFLFLVHAVAEAVGSLIRWDQRRLDVPGFEAFAAGVGSVRCSHGHRQEVSVNVSEHRDQRN